MIRDVPTEQYQQWQQRREEFFAMIDEVREQNKDLPPEVIEAEVDEAVQAVRRERREATRRGLSA